MRRVVRTPHVALADDMSLGATFSESAAVAAGVECAHCGLDVPPGFIDTAGAQQFCCSGCRTAFAILHEHGLDQYYEFAEKREQRVRSSGRSFEEFDHEAFQTLHVRETPDGLSRVELYLEGVHCASCVWLVERVPLLVPGVARAELQVRRSLATVEWDPHSVPLSGVARALDSLGYTPHPFRGLKREEMRRKEDRTALMRIGVAGAIAMNIMLASIALYSGWLSGMEHDFERFFRWTSLILVVPALLGPGRVFFVGALGALRTRSMHMDLPIAIGLGAGFVRGAANTVMESGPIYFDGLATLVFVLLVGRYLQQRGQRMATDAAELLYSLTPQSARIIDSDGTPHELPATALLPGMVLEVRAGETLAADGEVLGGESSLNMSLLTGESRPVAAALGSKVFAGTLNISAPLRVRVAEAGESSRVARILRQVEESSTRKAPVVLLADRMAGYFVAAVLVVAAGIYVYWSRVDPTRAADNAIALLIVTCPCALAMATPLAVTIGIGRAAKSGLFIKGGEVIELLSKPGRLFLDKTGTITEARMSVTSWSGPDWVKPLVVALEGESSHPIADGIRRAWTVAGAAIPAVERSEHVVGGGIAGRIGGREVVVGSPPFVAARLRTAGAAGSARAEADGEKSDAASTPVDVAVDGVVVGRALLGDPIRADARQSIDALSRAGWRIGILSGDAAGVVSAIGKHLAIPSGECRSEMTPEEKLRRVVAAADDGTVVMVGDGVNDAAAIAAASVGVGVHGGAEACLSTADVYLTRPGLEPLVRLSEGSARTMRVIRRHMAISLAYNAVGATLAVTGTINPLIAAIMMPASSLTVILGTWYSRSFDGEARAA